MPNWGKLEESLAAIAQKPAERLLEEASEAGMRLLRQSATEPAANSTLTARQIIDAAAKRGDLPADIYPDSETFTQLRDPRMLTVEHTYLSKNRLTLKADPPDGQWRTTGVYLNRERVGIIDRKGPLGDARFPVDFRSVNLVLSDRRTVSVPEQGLTVIDKWNRWDGRAWPDKKEVLSAVAEISPHTKLTFSQAAALRPGAQLIRDFPFQEVDGKLTNGRLSLPLDQVGDLRGYTAYPQALNRVEFLPEEHYQQLLQALKGEFADTAKLPEWARFTASDNGGPELKLDFSSQFKQRHQQWKPSESSRSNLIDGVRFDSTLLAQLKEERSVQVDSVEVTTHKLSLKPDLHDGKWLEEGVYIQGKRPDGSDYIERAGSFDQYGTNFRGDFPLTVNSAKIVLSNGESHTISDRSVTVIQDWGPVKDNGGFDPIAHDLFSAKPLRTAEGSPYLRPVAELENGSREDPFQSVDGSLVDAQYLHFKQVAALKPGSKLIREFPFQVVDGKLVNGEYRFPLQRSARAYSEVPEERWQELLASLKGRTLSEAKLPDWVKLNEGRVEFSKEILLNERPRLVLKKNLHVPETLSNESDASKQLNAENLPPVLIKHGGERVMVDSVTLSRHEASLRLDPREGTFLDHGVFLNGKRVGAFDRDGGTERHEFPLVINTAEVKLSDGRSLAVSDRFLRVITDWQSPNVLSTRPVFLPKYATLFSTKPIKVGPWDHFSLEQAQELRPGAEFTKRFPLLWDTDHLYGDRLTDGIFELPRSRPEGAEWRHWPIPAVKPGYWDSYLNALHGTYVDNLVERHPQVIKSLQESSAPVRRVLSKEQKEVQSVLKGEMWDGTLTDGEKEVDHISLGPAVIFKLPLQNGKTLHVVDNAGDGAIYLFEHYEDAEKLASGYMSRMAARELGHPFVIHSGEWKQKLAEAVREFSAKLQ